MAGEQRDSAAVQVSEAGKDGERAAQVKPVTMMDALDAQRDYIEARKAQAAAFSRVEALKDQLSAARADHDRASIATEHAWERAKDAAQGHVAEYVAELKRADEKG